MSLKYIYSSYNKEFFHIIRMSPIDYLNDVVKPTVKTRFYSKENKEIYFRFDHDNDVSMRNINCSNFIDTKSNINGHLILIDYNKGYFNKNTITSLYDYITSNDIKFKKVFINTKPSQLELYKNLIEYFNEINSETTIQLNELEFAPVRDIIFDMGFTNIIVTKGKNPVDLYNNNTIQSFSVKNIILNNMYTTSGCGDAYFSIIIYNMIYKNMSVEDAMSNMCAMKFLLKRLNDDLFI